MKLWRVFIISSFLGADAGYPQTPSAAAQIPAGTAIAAQTTDRINSRTAEAGHSFKASLDEPLIVNGQELAPKGAEVELRIVEVKKAGKFKGKAELSVIATAVKTGDRTLPVNTEPLVNESSGKGKSTAKKVGMLGAIGAATGGVLGGGTGAAAGAAIGAGGGAAASMLTSGPVVDIPAEARLTFVTK